VLSVLFVLCCFVPVCCHFSLQTNRWARWENASINDVNTSDSCDDKIRCSAVLLFHLLQCWDLIQFHIGMFARCQCEMLRLILSSDCNPRIEFSILGSGIKKFLILGYRDLVLRLHLSVISNVDKRMQALKVPLYPYHDIINYTNNPITFFDILLSVSGSG